MVVDAPTNGKNNLFHKNDGGIVGICWKRRSEDGRKMPNFIKTKV